MQKKVVDLTNMPSVELVEGSKSKLHAFYWHIYANEVRAGQVYIDLIDDPILGRHASIHIFLNKKNQGKGIGKIGYAKACQKSGLDEIYAHMRKSNIPSKRAASAAGFEEVINENFHQLVMVWKKTN